MQCSDGYLDLILIKDSPKLSLLSLMTGLANGSHVKSPYVMYLKVSHQNNKTVIWFSRCLSISLFSSCNKMSIYLPYQVYYFFAKYSLSFCIFQWTTGEGIHLGTWSPSRWPNNGRDHRRRWWVPGQRETNIQVWPEGTDGLWYTSDNYGSRFSYPIFSNITCDFNFW